MTRKTIFIIIGNLIFIGHLLANKEIPSYNLNTSFVYVNADTLKDPTGSKLAKKKKRLERSSVQRKDFDLSTTKKKADKLYKALGFLAAADLYEDLEGIERNEFVLSKLANSYRLNGQTEDAEYCYAQIVKDTDDPEHFLRYAQVLQSNGKCEDAVRWYKKYIATSFDTSREFILDCSELTTFKESDVDITNMESINTEHLDFSPIPYKDGVIFTSNRGSDKMAQRRDNWTKENFSDVFYAKKGKAGEFSKVSSLLGDINGKFHDGVPTFNKAGTFMIFTRNDKKGKNRDGNKDLKLYSAENEGGFWTNVQELPLNDKDYATCHPALSPDARRLYFASDREGGYGGMDVYYSEKIGGTWSEPTNLGPTINSAGNEIFPYMGQDETLYFASDGHRGLGGLDIFAVRKKNKNDESTWSVRENLGKPFNSEKDDFSFYINEDGEGGYFTSNRNGGKGGDDIYEWSGDINSSIVKSSSFERTICVYDENTGDRIEGASVSIFETVNGQTTKGLGDMYLTVRPLNEGSQDYILSIVDKKGGQLGGQNYFTTDQRGTFPYAPQPENDYIFVVEKDGYFTERKTIPSKDILKNEEYCFSLEKRNCLPLNGLVKNKDYPAFIPNAEVKLFNKCTGEVEATITDRDGNFDACLDCGCDYEIYATKPGFENGKTLVSTIQYDCIELDIDTPVKASIDLKPGALPLTNNNSYPNGQYATPNQPNVVYIPMNGNGVPVSPDKLNEYFLGDSGKPFEVGQVIRLSNIYYDFDEFYIRNDAQKELDYVLQLLKAYPSMELTLMSHTDSRGSSRYNQRLSRNRAKEAVEYLTSRGISKNRLIPIGFGEERLKNGCDDGVGCSENEHQLNRRTEIRISSLNEPGIRVEYEDNLPGRRK